MGNKSVLRALDEAIESMGRYRATDSNVQLGERLRTLRCELNLTQEQFGQRFGIPLANVRNWEQSHRNARPDNTAYLLLAMIELDPVRVAEIVSLIAKDREGIRARQRRVA